MLLTITFIIATLVFGYLEARNAKHFVSNFFMTIAFAAVLTGLVVCVLLCIFTGYSENLSQESMEDEYIVLTSKVDNGYYQNDTLLTYDLAKDIREYNNNVISMQNTVNSPWTNWFGRAWVRDLKTIDFLG